MKLCITGGDNFGWALDEDLKSFKSALPDYVEISDLKRCDVIYSPWWRGLNQLGLSALIGKRLLCGLDNPYFHWLSQPDFIPMSRVPSIWICHSRAELLKATSIGLETAYVPYFVDRKIFSQCHIANRHEVRKKYKIPDNSFVIGNFQRDSEGKHLFTPKLQKGPDVFIALVELIRNNIPNLHVLIGGPRRHWLRRELEKKNINYSYIGQEVDNDDIKLNLIKRIDLAKYYSALDLYLLTSRWEGGPYGILEAASCGIPVLATNVGLTKDLLQDEAIFTDLSEGAEKILNHYKNNTLNQYIEHNRKKIDNNYSISSMRSYVSDALDLAMGQPKFIPNSNQILTIRRPYKGGISGRVSRLIRNFIQRPKKINDIRISIIRDFVKPPYGGGNQFMLALVKAMQKMNIDVRNNEVGEDIDAYIMDSCWFQQKLLDRISMLENFKIIHRIDGPIHLYRGKDKHIDDKIMSINRDYATSTVIQSEFTLKNLISNGYEPKNPIIIRNACDSEIFYPGKNQSLKLNEKIKLISTSWSDNPRKGADYYEWMDKNIDFNRYEYKFIGRVPKKFDKIEVINPVPSKELSEHLREADIYITASQNDPCSNALIEALSCGKPALYLNSGGHPEIVGFGGVGFDGESQIISGLNKIADNYGTYRSCIMVNDIYSVARKYLASVGIL